jgi:hypothetical protein
MATKEELLERAKELDIPGRSTMDKGELEAAVADAEGDSSRFWYAHSSCCGGK